MRALTASWPARASMNQDRETRPRSATSAADSPSTPSPNANRCTAGTTSSIVCAGRGKRDPPEVPARDDCGRTVLPDPSFPYCTSVPFSRTPLASPGHRGTVDSAFARGLEQPNSSTCGLPESASHNRNDEFSNKQQEQSPASGNGLMDWAECSSSKARTRPESVAAEAYPVLCVLASEPPCS